MEVHVIKMAHMLTTLSTQEGSADPNAGMDAKRRRGRGVFNDDFEPEQESLIW